MIICVTGTYGTTSLVNRLVFDTFSIIHKPTILTTIYNENGYTVVDVPPSNKPQKCHVLIITCQRQKDAAYLAEKWLTYHQCLIVAIVNAPKERPILCTEPYLVSVDNMSREGIQDILRLIHINKNKSLLK